MENDFLPSPIWAQAASVLIIRGDQSTNVWRRVFAFDRSDELSQEDASKTFGFSLRCVGD